MRRRLLTLFAVAMMAATLLTPSFASARGHESPTPAPIELPEGVILDESSRSARAEYHTVRGCLESGIHVTLHEDKHAWVDGSSDQPRMVSLHAHQYNACTDTDVFDIEFYTDALKFNVNENFTGASVTGKAIAINSYGDLSDVPVTLFVNWTPRGSLSARDASLIVDGITHPETGEMIDVTQETTDYFRSAMARGVVTIGDQTFDFLTREEETIFYGFDNTWTQINQTPD